jgi:hypothetical protein
MRSAVDHVVVVGPIYSREEQAALTRTLPDDVARSWVVIDAAVSVTLARAQADPERGLSRDPESHRAAHRRLRKLLPTIPADRVFALLAVATDFATLGLMLFAAEAATTAVQAVRRSRCQRTTEAATLRVDYLNQCDPELSTPGLNMSMPTLTDRERQMAQLASTGTSSGEIATVSPCPAAPSTIT